MTSSSPFMDDYSSENYSSSDDESFEFADDYLLFPAEAEDQPIDDHENQPNEGEHIPELETSTDFMTRGRDEPPYMDRVSEALADKVKVWIEGFAEAVEDSDAETAVEEREMSDVEVDSEHEADKVTAEPEVLMELTEAAIEKYEEEIYNRVLAEFVAEAEAMIASDGVGSILASEPAVEGREAIIHELSHEVDAPEPIVEFNAVINEPSDEIDALAVEDEAVIFDAPAVGEDVVAVVTEVGFLINEPAVGADDVVAAVTEDGFVIDEADDEAVIDEPSEEFKSTVAPQPASDGSESSDEIDSSIEDYIAQVERLADEITGEYTSDDDVNHDWCSNSGGRVQSPEFDFMYEFANWTTSTPVVLMQELVTTLQSCVEMFLRELIRLRSQVSRFIGSLFDRRSFPDKSA